MFKNSDAKSQHKRKVKCIPFESKPEYNVNNIDNSTNTNTNITNNTMNNNTTNNNYINILNWSKETYEHISPVQIANMITTTCRDYPVQFFTEFPRLAHQKNHANVRCTNLRGQHMDVCENGVFRKVSSQSILVEAARRMCHRVDDAYNEDEEAFTRCRPTAEAIINMEDVINDSGDKQRSRHHTRVMGLEQRSARTEIMAATKAGLYV